MTATATTVMAAPTAVVELAAATVFCVATPPGELDFEACDSNDREDDLLKQLRGGAAVMVRCMGLKCDDGNDSDAAACTQT